MNQPLSGLNGEKLSVYSLRTALCFKDGNIATLEDYGIILLVYRIMIILAVVIVGPIALIN
jgi:hypothetical protein